MPCVIADLVMLLKRHRRQSLVAALRIAASRCLEFKVEFPHTTQDHLCLLSDGDIHFGVAFIREQVFGLEAFVLAFGLIRNYAT